MAHSWGPVILSFGEVVRLTAQSICVVLVDLVLFLCVLTRCTVDV